MLRRLWLLVGIDRPRDRQCQLLSCPGQLKKNGRRAKKSFPTPLWGHRLQVTTLVLSAGRPFGPARFTRRLDKKGTTIFTYGMKPVPQFWLKRNICYCNLLYCAESNSAPLLVRCLPKGIKLKCPASSAWHNSTKCLLEAELYSLEAEGYSLPVADGHLWPLRFAAHLEWVWA